MLAIFILIFSLAGSIHAVSTTSMRYVDMTHTYEETAQDVHGFQKIFVIDKLINESLETGGWYRAEIYRQNSHFGTHMDAPSHQTPTGKDIDEMPVSQFCGPAAVIDITQKARLNPDYEVTVDDLLEWESGIGQSLNGTIVLIRTGWEAKYRDKAEYLGSADGNENNMHYPGTSSAACNWLATNRTIKGLGTDTFSIERGVTFFRDHSYPCHEAILSNDMFLLEEVAIKKELPLYGAQLAALPQKIKRGSGAPVRIVAWFPEVIHNLP